MFRCRDAGLPRTQHCRDMGHCQHTAPSHPSLPALQEQQQPSLQGHRTLQECRTAACPALQEHEAPRDAACPALQGCRALQGHGALQRCRAATPPAVQGHGARLWQGQSSTALAALPAQWHCQPRTARYRGTTHPALQGCRGPEHHPSCTARGALPPPVPLAIRGTPGPCPGCAAVQEPPRAARGSAQPRHTATAAQHPPRCTVTRQPHTLRQQLLFPSSLQTHCSFPFPPTPVWDVARTGCPPCASAHPAAAAAVPGALPPCIAETPLHCCTPAPLPPPLAPLSHAHTLPRPCQAHCQPHRLTPPVPSLIPYHQAPV